MVCTSYLRVHVPLKWGQCDHLVIIVVYNMTDITLFMTWHDVVYCLHVVYTRDTTRVTMVGPSGRVTVQCHINVPTFTVIDRCVWERSCSSTSTPDSKNNDFMSLSYFHFGVLKIILPSKITLKQTGQLVLFTTIIIESHLGELIRDFSKFDEFD